MSRKELAFINKEIKKYKKIYQRELKNRKNKNENPIEWKNSKGNLHRDNGPAVIYKNGEHSWYKNGKSHNTKGPAIINYNKSYLYVVNDKSHRENDPAIIWNQKEKIWKFHDKRHRINGFSYINITKIPDVLQEEANIYQEIYMLYVDDICYSDPEEYVKACKKWILENETAHACLEIFEELDKNLKEGKFDKNNWKSGKFIKNKKGKNAKINKPDKQQRKITP